MYGARLQGASQKSSPAACHAVSTGATKVPSYTIICLIHRFFFGWVVRFTRLVNVSNCLGAGWAYLLSHQALQLRPFTGYRM